MTTGSEKNTPPASPAASSTGMFPRKAALALGVAVSVLLLAHFVPGNSRGLTPAIIPEAATLHWPHAPAPATVATLPLNGVQQTPSQTQPIAQQHSSGNMAKTGGTHSSAGTSGGAPVQLTTSPAGVQLQDANGALDPFFAQLWALQQRGQPQVVTVLHYGDSPTTADLITGDIRSMLQERFGDAGKGFNLGAKPWAWYGHRDVDMSDKGWTSSQKDATPVGRMKASVYGLGGGIFAGGVGAQTTYTLRGAAQTSVVVDYLGTSGGTLAVSGNGTRLATIDTAGSGAMTREVALPDGTTVVKLEVTGGTVKLFGVDFRRGTNGVIYDSLGLNGATTTVLSRTFDPATWAAELQAARPSLIVINYGTNESQFGGLVETLDRELRAAIEKTRAAAPGVPILVMSPMDRGEHAGLSDIHTNPLIPRIVAIQQQVAADEHCAFFNTYAAMGGDGTMARWYAAKPRLITADLIHPTPQGAEYVAQLMVAALYRSYDQWKATHGIGVVVVQDPVAAAAQRKANLEEKKAAAAKLRADAKEARQARLHQPPAPRVVEK